MPARAALAGNPSDGFGGATLAVTLPCFAATVWVEPAERLTVEPAAADLVCADSLAALVSDVRAHGYAGGLPLVKAALVRFAGLLAERGLPSPEANVAIRYATTIPRGVGLAGSSAIVVATLRALAEFHGVAIPPAALAAAALAAEVEELGIAAGPQDRFVQAHGGLLFMDFADGGCAVERLDTALLPPLFVAFLADSAEPSTAVHGELRRRWAAGEPELVQAMAELATLARLARDAIAAGDTATFATCLDRSFDERRRILPLDPRHEQLISLARANGCAANYAGSGGAIVGLPREPGASLPPELATALAAEGCDLVEHATAGVRARNAT